MAHNVDSGHTFPAQFQTDVSMTADNPFPGAWAGYGGLPQKSDEISLMGEICNGEVVTNIDRQSGFRGRRNTATAMMQTDAANPFMLRPASKRILEATEHDKPERESGASSSGSSSSSDDDEERDKRQRQSPPPPVQPPPSMQPPIPPPVQTQSSHQHQEHVHNKRPTEPHVFGSNPMLQRYLDERGVAHSKPAPVHTPVSAPTPTPATVRAPLNPTQPQQRPNDSVWTPPTQWRLRSKEERMAMVIKLEMEKMYFMGRLGMFVDRGKLLTIDPDADIDALSSAVLMYKTMSEFEETVQTYQGTCEFVAGTCEDMEQMFPNCPFRFTGMTKNLRNEHMRLRPHFERLYLKHGAWLGNPYFAIAAIIVNVAKSTHKQNIEEAANEAVRAGQNVINRHRQDSMEEMSDTPTMPTQSVTRPVSPTSTISTTVSTKPTTKKRTAVSTTTTTTAIPDSTFKVPQTPLSKRPRFDRK